ncbi:VWD domain-containing protein [Microcoleus sp. N9_B4]
MPPFPQDPGPNQPLRPDFDNPPTGQTTVTTQVPNLEGIWLYAGSYQPDFSGLVVGRFMRFSVVDGALTIDKCSSNCISEIQYPVLNNSTVPFEQMLEVDFADDDMKIKLFPNKDFTLFLGIADKVENQNSQLIYFFISKLSQSKYPARNNRQRKTSNKQEVFLLASNINNSKLEIGKKQEVFLLAENKKISNGIWSSTANPHSAYSQFGGFSNANLTKDQALATRFTQTPTDTFTLGTPDTQRSGFGGKGPNNLNNNPSQNNNRGGNGSSGGNGNQRRNNNSNTGTSREEQAIQLGQDQAPQQIDLLQGGVNKIGDSMQSLLNNLGTQKNTIAGVGGAIGLATTLGLGNANASANASEMGNPVDDAAQIAALSSGMRYFNASSWGDPHLTSFDGQKYDHHAIGEFVLTRSKDKHFEVQVREAPYGSSSSLGINIAAAMRVGNDRVAIYSQDFPDNNTQDPLRVNGKTISGEKQNLSGGGFVARTGSGSYLVQWPSDEQVTVKIFNKLVEVTPGVTEGDRGQLEGLLGNFNGNPSDDFMTRDGRVIAENKEAMNIARSVLSNFDVSRWIPIPLDPLTEAFLDSIHRQFGDSWRISQTESLFDYPAGKNTDSFTNKSFPNGFKILRMLAPQAVQLAEETCRKAEVPSERLEGCLFDVAASGDVSLASVAANILKNEVKQRVEQEIRNRVPIPIPLPF